MFDIIFLTICAIAIIFGIIKNNFLCYAFTILALVVALIQGIIINNQTLVFFASGIIIANLFGLYREFQRTQNSKIKK